MAAPTNNGYSKPIDQNIYAQVMGAGFGAPSASYEQNYKQSGYAQSASRAGEAVVGLRFVSIICSVIS